MMKDIQDYKKIIASTTIIINKNFPVLFQLSL